MAIVATTETRNAHWANDQSAFGRKMLSKMGWKGDGLGKHQQGSSTHLRAVKRSESLGIGAESDAFGDKGWQEMNAGFHGVLANLKREYSSVGGDNDNSNSDSNSNDVDVDVDEATKKKRRKEEKKRKKKEEKRRAKRRNISSGGEGANSISSDAGNRNGIRLPQNKVQAGHARKMREAKDIRNKSSADMAAIFGVKADFYKQPRDWIEGGGEDSGQEKKKKKKSPKKKSEKKESKRKRSSDEDGNGSDNSKKKKRKKDKSK